MGANRAAWSIVVGMLAADAAAAQPDAPCVARRRAGDGVGTLPMHAHLGAAALEWCPRQTVYEPCWAMDLATRAFTARRAPSAHASASASKVRCGDDACELSAGGAPAAWSIRATRQQATLCRAGRCKTIAYPFARAATMKDAVPKTGVDGRPRATRPVLDVAVDGAGTVAAVTVAEPRGGKRVVVLDLVAQRLVTHVAATSAAAIAGRSIVVDRTFLDAAGKQLGVIEDAYSPWLDGRTATRAAIADTGLIAFAHARTARLVIADAATAKVRHRLALPLAPAAGELDATEPYTLVAGADGATLHVLAGAPHLGQVVTIDVAAGHVIASSAPPRCR